VRLSPSTLATCARVEIDARDSDKMSEFLAFSLRSGSVNGVDFVVKRSVRGGKVEAHVLNLMVGGEDRTKQSIRDTQVELESLLPVAAICDGAFHGQHLVRGLLERTDVDFKKVIFPLCFFSALAVMRGLMTVTEPC
jgi:hypothetical protein